MNTDSREYKTIVIAGLLHDIGKLLQRGSFGGIDISGKHPKVSFDFVNAFSDCFDSVSDVSLLKTLVQKHHESHHFEADLNISSITDEHIHALAALVSLSNNLSSAERNTDAREWQDYIDTPMGSVLERVNNVTVESPQVRYHAAPLATPDTLERLFPEQMRSHNQDELTQFIKQFGTDFQTLFKTGAHKVINSDFDCVVTHLYSLLYKYTWCLPSNTQELFPDISLFDHLRTTSAIASCLYLYHTANDSLDTGSLKDENSEQFLLLTGDVSGIQNYIFDISSIGAGGVARRLRARSMYVQLCTEVASHLILRRLGLPVAIHTIMNSGGHFYLLLPNLEEVKKTISDCRQHIEKWLFGKLNGELGLSIATVEFGMSGFRQSGDNDRTGFGMVIETGNRFLEKEKKKRFAGFVQHEGKWNEAAFEIPIDFAGEDICIACRKFPQEKDGLCATCSSDLFVGRNLPGARIFAFYDNETTGDIKLLGYSVSIDRIDQSNPPYLIVSMNETGLSDYAAYPAVFRYLAKTVPLADDCPVCRAEDSSLATFECIAGRAEGDKLLGFLKMDVDNLGETVIFGLKPGFDSISRTVTFSRMLDMFFSGYVEGLARKNNGLYTVFSGGDDLFLVGPWDLILKTAEHIRREFLRFTNNPGLTISAGVIINSHSYPIATAADEVQEALQSSKACEGKGSITVLNETVTWAEWERITREWFELKKLAEREEIRSSLLFSLQSFSAMWRDYRRNGNVLGLRYHPLLAYSVRRNINSRTSPGVFAWVNELLSLKPGDERRFFLLDNLGLITKLLILSKRGQ